MKQILAIGILATLTGAYAGAQDWSELETLTFAPERPAAARYARDAIARRPVRGDSKSTRVRSPEPRFPDPWDAPPSEQLMEQIGAAVAAVEEEEAARGESSPSLVPLLTTLSGLYQEIGDHAEAVAVLERAQQLLRVQKGLYTLEQVDVLEQMIESHIAIAPGEQSAELESDLLELVRRHPDDPQVPHILRNKADRQMDVARYMLVNGVPPEIVIDFGFSGGTPWNQYVPPRTARYMASSMLRRARRNYGTAIRQALRDDSPDIPLLLELEDSIVDSYYFELRNPGLRRDRQSYKHSRRLYYGGLDVLEAKLANARRYPGTPLAIANAMVEVADWHLLFLSFGRAMQSYDAALEYLKAREVGDELMAELFSPERPVPLPAYGPDANVFSGAGNVHGYIDVTVEVNRYGTVRGVETLRQSDNSSEAIESRLKGFVYRSRFRPRRIDGEWQGSERFDIRYRFSYASTYGETAGS